MPSRDKAGRAILSSLLAWSQAGPARGITGTERRVLARRLLPGLTDEEFRGGLAWASGITGTPELAGNEPCPVSAELAAQIARILRDGAGEEPPAAPQELQLAMIELASEAEAAEIALRARYAGMLDVSEAGFRKAATAPDPVLALGCASNLCEALTQAGRYDEAIAACDAAVTRFPAAGPDADGALASLLYNQAVALRTRNDERPGYAEANPAESAEAGPGGNLVGREPAMAFAAVAAKFAGSQDIKARELAARARLNESAAYLRTDDPGRGLQSCDAFLAVFDSDGPCPWWDAIASVLVNRASALFMLSREREASAVCDEVYRRFDQIPDPVFGTLVARAALLQGRALAKLGERKAAISAYQRASQFLEQDGELGQIAGQASAEARVQEIEAAQQDLASCDQFLARPPDAGHPRDRLLRAAYTVNRGVALAALERYEDAVSTYEALISEIKDDADPELRVQLAMATMNCGNSNRALGRDERARRCYRDIEDDFGDSADPRLLLRVASAILNQGVIYQSGGDAEQAISEFKRAGDRFAGASDADVRDIALSALWNVVTVSLGHQGLSTAAAALQQIIDRFGADGNARIRHRVAGCTVSLALEAAQRGELAAALGALATVTRYAGDPDPDVREIAQQAQDIRLALGAR